MTPVRYVISEEPNADVSVSFDATGFTVLAWIQEPERKYWQEIRYPLADLKPWDIQGAIESTGVLSIFFDVEDLVPLVRKWNDKAPPEVEQPIHVNHFAKWFRDRGFHDIPDEGRANCLYAYVHTPAHVRESKECYLSPEELSFLRATGL